jgi:hypothetical protein
MASWLSRPRAMALVSVGCFGTGGTKMMAPGKQWFGWY